jgi:serine protease Do
MEANRTQLEQTNDMIAGKYGDCPSRLTATVWLILTISLGFCQSGFAQERNGQQRKSLKPAVATYFSTSIDDPTANTKLTLPPGLKLIAKGANPQSKEDLRLLQTQQSQLAKNLPLVTVNLQHGNTQGSGVIVSGDGYILTAAHVAGKPSQKIQITLHDGTRVEGESLGLNRNEDAGLVRISNPLRKTSNPWPHATLGRSSEYSQGSWVIAVGHPGGWQPDRPAVIRVGRLLKTSDSTLVTDCPLIGGDSGGPLFDLEGKLIGIHSRIGVDVVENMHVPIEVFYKSHERLLSREVWGSLPGFKPYIGVAGVKEEESNGRCIIQDVGPGTPAEKAGMLRGDIVVRFDGQKISKFKELKDAVDSLVPGDNVMLEVERNAKLITLRITIGSLNQ